MRCFPIPLCHIHPHRLHCCTGPSCVASLSWDFCSQAQSPIPGGCTAQAPSQQWKQRLVWRWLGNGPELRISVLTWCIFSEASVISSSACTSLSVSPGLTLSLPVSLSHGILGAEVWTHSRENAEGQCSPCESFPALMMTLGTELLSQGHLHTLLSSWNIYIKGPFPWVCEDAMLRRAGLLEPKCLLGIGNPWNLRSISSWEQQQKGQRIKSVMTQVAEEQKSLQLECHHTLFRHSCHTPQVLFAAFTLQTWGKNNMGQEMSQWAQWLDFSSDI